MTDAAGIPLEAAPVLALARPHAPNLCDACLGRLFARLGEATGNPTRGAIIRGALPSTTPATCQLCESMLTRLGAWADLCVDAARDREYATFLVGSTIFGDVRRRELALYEDLAARDEAKIAASFPAKTNSPPWPVGEWLKSEINREVGRLIEAKTGKKPDFARPEITFRLDTRFDHVDLQVADLFVRGRYKKFVRDLPQTRWPCRGCGGIGCRQCDGSGKTYETSVEELVAAPFLAASGATGEAFHGMGREDIDARTLGTGRPFVLELKNPKRRGLDLASLEVGVNAANPGRVEILEIGPAGPDDAARYKAADPSKTYQALCVAKAPIERAALESALAGLVGVELEQRTPQRVAHRRADLVRNRSIRALSILDHTPTRFRLEITADSGTYIKEFVSGDEGRTKPSVSERIGVPCVVEELDVVGVHWNEQN